MPIRLGGSRWSSGSNRWCGGRSDVFRSVLIEAGPDSLFFRISHRKPVPLFPENTQCEVHAPRALSVPAPAEYGPPNISSEPRSFVAASSATALYELLALLDPRRIAVPIIALACIPICCVSVSALCFRVCKMRNRHRLFAFSIFNLFILFAAAALGSWQ